MAPKLRLLSPCPSFGVDIVVSLKPFLHAGTALALAAALWLPGKLALSAGSSRTEANTGTERGARLLERSVVRIEVDGRRECIGVAISDSAVLTAKHCLKSSTSLAVRAMGHAHAHPATVEEDRRQLQKTGLSSVFGLRSSVR